MDYRIDELEAWDTRILDVARKAGLDWFEIEYELIDATAMIGAMAFHGMPVHFNHWSFGKAYERTRHMYDSGVEGLPYELIINSNSSLAYLMRENPLYLQVLIMAHCVGHSDFFKNNRLFKGTRPDTIIGRMRSAKKRIQSYVENVHVGIDKVEEVIDACHAVQFQGMRPGWIRRTRKEIIDAYVEEKERDEDTPDLNLDKNPLEPDYDLLGFIAENAKLPEWKKDIIEVCRDEGQYFWPQIQTKIMNEGWASYWHYTILHELGLPPELHVPFIKSHNQVIRPHVGGLNPYHLGFEMFKRIRDRHGLDECFLARETHRDSSFLHQYLTESDCEELGLFTFSEKKTGAITIDEISDEEGWKHVRDTLVKNVGGGGIPIIYVENVNRSGTLVLDHEHDGRDLLIAEASETVKHVATLWDNPVSLSTLVDGKTHRVEASV